MDFESSTLNSRRDSTVGENPGFSQPGIVDWTKSIQGVLTPSIESMARMSRAGIDAITLHAGYAIAARARLSAKGEARVQNAVDELRAFPSFDKSLWFGFGAEHIIHEMRESREGVFCIAICAALTEMYSVSFSARVLRELYLLCDPPQDLTPAIRQWYALVEVSAGVLAQTEFSLELHQLSKQYLSVVEQTSLLRGPSTVAAIAVALHAIFDISTGQRETIEIVGGPDCALLAMVAHWMLGITTEIKASLGGVLFRSDGSTQSSQRPRLIVIFEKGTSEPAQVVRHQYSVLSGRGFFVASSSMKGQDSVSFGRPPWDTCLTDTFGEPVRRLLTILAPSAGLWLGSAAKILETSRCGSIAGETHGIPDITDDHVLDIPLSTATSGREFCSWALKLLPELARAPDLATRMEQSATGDYRDASESLRKAWSDLTSSCTCPKHRSGKAGKWEYCLIDLMIFINHLIRVVSGTRHMSAASDEGYIRPVACGMLRIFNNVLHRQYPNPKEDDVALGIRRIFRLEAWCFWEDVVRLFSGSDPPSDFIIKHHSAVSQNGICFFLNTLCDITTDARQMGKVCIATGAIQCHSRQYRAVVDGGEPLKPMPLVLINRSSSGQDLSTRLIIEESVDPRSFNTLLAHYRITQASDEHRIWPAKVAWALNRSSFTKNCRVSTATCHTLQPDVRDCFRDIDDPHGCADVGDSDLYLLARDQRPQHGPWLALLNMGSLRGIVPEKRNWDEFIHVFQGDMCLPCCIHLIRLLMRRRENNGCVIVPPPRRTACIHSSEDATP